MNKEKAIKTIDQIIGEIRENLNEESKLYVNTWVIGSLNVLKSKVNGDVWHRDSATYEELFRDFINVYFCRRIEPSIKIYAIGSLFSYEIVDLIIELFETLFTLQKRIEICNSVNYIEWRNLETRHSKLEVIRRYFGEYYENQ